MRYLFVTGRLAAPALRRVLAELAPAAGFDYEVAVLNISVAALMTSDWVARHLSPASGIDRVMLSGYCTGDLRPIEDKTGVPVERGPRDLRDLPEHFSQPPLADYGRYDIEILAEINHAARLDQAALLRQALDLRHAGADVIDLGCDPGGEWSNIGDAVGMLRDQGLRVAVDSMNPVEVASAVAAGAELVLSVNRLNCPAAVDWGCEVVAVPDSPADLESLDETVAALSAAGVRFRIDPILEPIGLGFTASLARYANIRRRYPQAEMLMGVANLTELTDVDSAGVNVLLLGICQELGVRSVLTTQVINWARSSVRELDLARRLVYYACTRQVVAKHLEPRLVMLRDPKLRQFGTDALAALAENVTDKNVRIFAEEGVIHLLASRRHFHGDDPFVLFDELARHLPIDAGHAFYLGYEMAKAATALTLSKNYVQDEALNWGLLTFPEKEHRLPPLAADRDQPANA